MVENSEVRVDKWLWSVRVYKTRSQATEACRNGKVFIDDQAVKPSRNIKEEEVLQVKKNPAVFTYKVKKLLSKRVGAKLVDDYLEDLTPEEEKEKLKLKDTSGFFVRDRGTGRPTKRERRQMDKIRRDGLKF